MDQIELLVIFFGVLTALGLFGAQYLAVKKFIRDLADAIEDDVISKEELQLLISDSLGIINVFKHLIGK